MKQLYYFQWLSLACCSIFYTSCAQKPTPATTSLVSEVATTAIPIDTTWTEKVVKTNEAWRKILTPEQYHIMREEGTEKPFSCPLTQIKDKGIFFCAGCKNPLFSANTKFDSGTGWPSYNQPFSSKSITTRADDSYGMQRIAVQCARCDAHLGHVFDDGPPPTGLRYCIDGVALIFEKYK